MHFVAGQEQVKNQHTATSSRFISPSRPKIGGYSNFLNLHRWTRTPSIICTTDIRSWTRKIDGRREDYEYESRTSNGRYRGPRIASQSETEIDMDLFWPVNSGEKHFRFSPHMTGNSLSTFCALVIIKVRDRPITNTSTWTFIPTLIVSRIWYQSLPWMGTHLHKHSSMRTWSVRQLKLPDTSSQSVNRQCWKRMPKERDW